MVEGIEEAWSCLLSRRLNSHAAVFEGRTVHATKLRKARKYYIRSDEACLGQIDFMDQGPIWYYYHSLYYSIL